MATVKIKWRPSSIDGKAGTIYYQIIHNRKVRRSGTDYKVFADEWCSATGSVATLGRTERRTDELSAVRHSVAGDIKRLNAIIRRLDKGSAPYTADDIVAAFDNRLPECSFFNFMLGTIASLKQLNRHRTAENYTTTLRSFMRFRGGEDLLPEEMDSQMMMSFEAALSARGATRNTTSFYMRILRAVYNRAVEKGLTEQRNPFRHVYTGIDKTVKRALPVCVIKRIGELDLSERPTLDFARDMFMFSFFMRGMSFVDMAYLRRSDLRNGVITYRRRKTGQLLTIRWERCMQKIIEKYERQRQMRPVPPGVQYLLPVLRQRGDGSRQYRNVLQQVNKALKDVASLADVKIPLTMYVARHSWASVAQSMNIPVSVISEGMGHNSETTTRIYLSSLDTAVIDRANRIILKGVL